LQLVDQSKRRHIVRALACFFSATTVGCILIFVSLPVAAGYSPEDLFQHTKAGPGVMLLVAVWVLVAALLSFLTIRTSRGISKWSESQRSRSWRAVRDALVIVGIVVSGAILPASIGIGALRYQEMIEAGPPTLLSATLDRVNDAITLGIAPIVAAFGVVALVFDAIVSYQKRRKDEDRSLAEQYGPSSTGT
jgi:mannose/fructose/N-acetylgalactosamine-specific phosphotransferase system component IID